eukprot:1157540-Pelagomonas_calceolata.AAC.15
MATVPCVLDPHPVSLITHGNSTLRRRSKQLFSLALTLQEPSNELPAQAACNTLVSMQMVV